MLSNRKVILCLPFMTAFLLMVGCTPDKKDMLNFLRQHEHEVSAIEYRVGIPDSITITAPRVDEIDGDNKQIQPDGKITLKLLGEVKVVGMTAKEIAAKLELLLSRYYVDPKVSVSIASYASKKYYVTGMVGSPGPRIYTGRDTLLDAVVGSGVNFMSWTSRVRVTRPNADEADPLVVTIDVDRMVRAGEWEHNILLEPDDIVHVPPTPLAWVGLRVRELLFPVEPAISAYIAPARIRDANQVYEKDENGNPRRTVGNFNLP